MIKESQGKIADAADVLQELQVGMALAGYCVRTCGRGSCDLKEGSCDLVCMLCLGSCDQMRGIM